MERIGSELVTPLLQKLPSTDNWMHCSCCGNMDATGVVGLVRLQLKMGISLYFNGREQMDATGIGQSVRMQVKAGILPFSNG